MDVIDLTPEHETPYLQCLEDWSEEMKEAGAHFCTTEELMTRYR